MNREREDGNGPGDIGSFAPPAAGRKVTFEIPSNARFLPCRGCLTSITFIVTGLGKKMPVNEDGTPHWATCPNSPEFRKKKQLEARLAELKAEKA